MKPNVVVIGGGNGTATLLKGLRNVTDRLTAIVSMADNGGSTGLLRKEQGVSAAGDARQCLVALSDSPELQKLFSYRFAGGSLDGHSFGNLFLAAAEKSTGNFEVALRVTGKLLGVQGQVLPVTDTNDVQLVMDQDGKETIGVYEIATMQVYKPQLHLEPKATLAASAGRAISQADFVMIAPGNLYGSIAPALLVEGMREALEQTNAKVVYVCNLVNRNGQTEGFTVHDYAAEIERFIGAPVLDFVLYNNAPVEGGMRETESRVEFDEAALSAEHYLARGLDLVDKTPATIDPNDKIPHIRSLVRHDADAVAKTLMEL